MAYDSAGNALSVAAFNQSLFVNPQPMLYPWTNDSCHEAFDSCGNLVCNGDFEWISDSISNAGQAYLAQPWNELGSTDLYNQQSKTYLYNTPSNSIGYQSNHTNGVGMSGYAGIVFWHYSANYYREYLSQQMKAPLKSSQRYAIEMYASLSDTSKYASNGIQVVFSLNSYYTGATSYNLVYTGPNMVDVLGNNTLTDTTNWYHYYSEYVPQSSGQIFITIGNFKQPSALVIDTLNNFPLTPLNEYVYYYIDDISLTPLPPKLNLTDQYTCNPGDTIVLYANAVGDSTLLWSTSSTADSIIVAPMVDTFYTVTATDYLGCHTITDTVYVYIALLTPWVGGEAVYSARILLGIDPDLHGIAYRLQKDSTKSNISDKVKLYPNPTNSNITLQFTNTIEGNISIKVIDILGKTLIEDNYKASNTILINLDNLKSGVYNILIYTNNNLYENKTFIKY